MIEKLKWCGWLIATGFALLLLMQRSCSKSDKDSHVLTRDTILVRGDTQLYVVQDTVIQPYKVYLKDSISHIDTAAVLKNYFASRVYKDTVKARDITAVIEDSISANKIAGHKVLIENARDLQMKVPVSTSKNKLFVGGFIGCSAKGMFPVGGVFLAFVTRKEMQYYYGYDALNRIHSIGLSWKIHLSKVWQ